jgi:hypothetical protein
MSVDAENIRLCRDDFEDWCVDNGVDLDHTEDWSAWWSCWTHAVEAKEKLTTHD